MSKRLDTVTQFSDVTLLIRMVWIPVGRPKLACAAVQAEIRKPQGNHVLRPLQVHIAIDGRQGSGTCHVADTSSLLGLDWLAQVEPLFDRLVESTSRSAISDSTLATVQSSLTTWLRKEFSAVFVPGLDC
ncbi:hypothetical protein V3C99_014605 [Haemonchus contortus]|uniref:Transposase n=1 Tax=Haemonchus contortus TaxID=6289 RepID=A0A7I4YTS7_HAECO